MDPFLALRIYFFIGFSNAHLMFCFNSFDGILDDVKKDKMLIFPFLIFCCLVASVWPITLVCWLIDVVERNKT